MADTSTKATSKHVESAQVARLTRNTVIVVLIGAVIASLIWWFWYRPQATELEEAREDLVLAEQVTAAIQDDLDAVRSGAPGSLRNLFERVQLVDEAVPASYDALETAVWLQSTSAGLVTLTINEGSRESSAEDANISEYRFSVSASGTREQVNQWVDRVQQAADRFITVRSVNVSGLSSDTGEVNASADLAVWVSDLDPLTSARPPASTEPAVPDEGPDGPPSGDQGPGGPGTDDPDVDGPDPDDPAGENGLSEQPAAPGEEQPDLPDAEVELEPSAEDGLLDIVEP